MKKICLFAMAVSTMWACSSDDLVNETAGGKATQTPIGFSVQKQNITRAANLETLNHYNFGAWAYKVSGNNNLPDNEVMGNYLVGWSDGTSKGYNPSRATTFARLANNQSGYDPSTTTNHDDHLSPWFYEYLGYNDYKEDATGYTYTKSDTEYMSNKEHQYLRYWDLAYDYTNFYCYAPYVHETSGDNTKKVTFTHDSETSTMTFASKTIRDGYDQTLNEEYKTNDRSLSEFMYAGVHAKNSDLQDVVVPFKHMGAQLFIRFYEDIPDYKVEIIDLKDDYGTLASGVSGDYTTDGIQLAPATKKDGETYEKAKYYTTQGATVTFRELDASASYEANWVDSEETGTPLMFLIPTNSKSTEATPANLTLYEGHNIIPEKVTEGTLTQKFSYSPTIYYPVAQPIESKTGFTIHISYRIIAEDNNEVVTVHNATVFVPASGKLNDTDNGETQIAAWQPNKKYTYTFMITKNTTGTTNPGTKIDPTDPTPSGIKALFPIVFDQATIEEYKDVNYNPVISEGTNYKD